MKKKKVRRSRSEWEGLVKQQEGSGQSIEAFCAGLGIKSGTLHYWRSKLKKKPASSNGFVSVTSGYGSVPGLVLRSRSGVEIEISSDVPMEKIRDLIAALSC
jgi:hypothetical protein